MKIWLDDMRPAPEGFVWCRSVNEAKRLIDQAFCLVDTPAPYKALRRRAHVIQPDFHGSSRDDSFLGRIPISASASLL